MSAEYAAVLGALGGTLVASGVFWVGVWVWDCRCRWLDHRFGRGGYCARCGKVGPL